MKRTFPINIQITSAFCICGALAVLILPLRWLAAAGIAAAVHEFSHLLALGFCRVPIYGIRIGAGGAQIDTAPMDSGQELLCAAAGPAGSFLLMLLIRRFPLLGIFAGIQGFFNMLPVYPFDGGRMLFCLLELVCPDKKKLVMDVTAGVVIIMISALGLYLAMVLKLGAGVLMLAALMLRKLLPIKRPCKACLKRVQ